MSGELYTFSDRFGGHWPDPVTGVVVPTRIRVTEYLDRSQDLRCYSVMHRACYSGRVIRSAEFCAAGYFGEPGNLCGEREASTARALGRAWYAEGRAQ